MANSVGTYVARAVVMLSALSVLGWYWHDYGLSQFHWFSIRDRQQIIEREFTLAGSLKPGFFAGEVRDVQISQKGLQFLRFRGMADSAAASTASDVRAYLNGKRISSASALVSDLGELQFYIEKYWTGSGRRGERPYSIDVTRIPLDGGLKLDDIAPVSAILVQWEQVGRGMWVAEIGPYAGIRGGLSIIVPRQLPVVSRSLPFEIPVVIRDYEDSRRGGLLQRRGGFLQSCLDYSLGRGGLYMPTGESERSGRFEWIRTDAPLRLEMRLDLESETWRPYDSLGPKCSESRAAWRKLDAADLARVYEGLGSLETVVMVARLWAPGR